MTIRKVLITVTSTLRLVNGLHSQFSNFPNPSSNIRNRRKNNWDFGVIQFIVGSSISAVLHSIKVAASGEWAMLLDRSFSIDSMTGEAQGHFIFRRHQRVIICLGIPSQVQTPSIVINPTSETHQFLTTQMLEKIKESEASGSRLRKSHFGGDAKQDTRTDFPNGYLDQLFWDE